MLYFFWSSYSMLLIGAEQQMGADGYWTDRKSCHELNAYCLTH